MKAILKKTLLVLFSTTIFFYNSPKVYSASNNYYKLENIVDIKTKHWCYQALKYVVEDLGIMEPKTPTRFLGDKLVTRYEIARAFYTAVKSLESISEKSLKISLVNNSSELTDVNIYNKKIVDSIVNQYGIMQIFPDSKFMGNREMTRYELSYDLNNYLTLLESKIDNVIYKNRSKAEEFLDLQKNHWAFNAVKNLVDKYQIMDGYPQKVFGGDQKLTRYEVAAILRRFVEYVDKKILNKPKPIEIANATPTPLTTPIPSITPIPTPIPTSIPSLSTSNFKITAVSSKLRFGLYSLLNSSNGSNFNKFDPGFNGEINLWANKLGLSFKLGYLSDDKIQQDAKHLGISSTIIYNFLSKENTSNLTLFGGLGIDYNTFFQSSKNLFASGINSYLEFEMPINSIINLNINDSLSYLFIGEQGWKNNLFLGINSPISDKLSLLLGYNGTIYNITNISNTIVQNGLDFSIKLNL